MSATNTIDAAYFDKKADQWDAYTARVKRAEHIYKSIAAEITIHTDDTVLDFGCGTGLLGFNFMNEVKSVTFADASVGMLEQVKKKAENLPAGKVKLLNAATEAIRETYTIIVSLLALHHVEPLDETLCNLSNHVAENGYICLSDLDVEDGSFHYPQIVPHNGIDREDVIRNVTKSGMRIICNKTVFIEERRVDGKKKTYPIFLIIGKR